MQCFILHLEREGLNGVVKLILITGCITTSDWLNRIAYNHKG